MPQYGPLNNVEGLNDNNDPPAVDSRITPTLSVRYGKISAIIAVMVALMGVFVLLSHSETRFAYLKGG
jgi:hypothetical protein